MCRIRVQGECTMVIKLVMQLVAAPVVYQFQHPVVIVQTINLLFQFQFAVDLRFGSNSLKKFLLERLCDFICILAFLLSQCFSINL